MDEKKTLHFLIKYPTMTQVPMAFHGEDEDMTLTATLPRSFPAIAGQEVDLYPVPSEFTVAQAAKRLRMSENHLSDLLDAEYIPFLLKNGERFISQDSLLEYEQMRKRRGAWLDEMARENQEMGFYD